jgi:hypothetical protein
VIADRDRPVHAATPTWWDAGPIDDDWRATSFEDRTSEKTSRLLRTGDFGFVPAGLAHAYRVEEPARILGVVSGGFERFFQAMGTPTDRADPVPPFVPDSPRMQAAAAEHRMRFLEPGQRPR